MGFLTTVTLHNDYQHEHRADLGAFAALLFRLLDETSMHNLDAALAGIKVHPSRHADDHTVYVHHGNTTISLVSRDFDEMVRCAPNAAEDYVRVAERIIRQARAELEKAKNQATVRLKPRKAKPRKARKP